MTSEPDWFASIAHARSIELRGWTRCAALLWAAQLKGNWWAPQYENETEALSQPEIQLSPSTADQYARVWSVFREQPIEELERVRPRLLFQACEVLEALKPEEVPEKAAEALSDALVLSFSSYVAKWRPRKTPPRK